MLKLFEIYRKDSATRDRSRYSTVWSRALVCVVVAVLSIFFNDISLDFLAAVLAVQSILAGFGFNVLVFLTTNKSIPIPPTAKIERKLKIARVNDLGKEIFYNISYFNTIALLSIATALALATTKAFCGNEIFAWWAKRYHLSDLGRIVYEVALFVAPRVGAAALYLFIILAVMTFMRLINRSTYYFEQKIALSDHDVT